jgi:Sec63 Brl domain
MDVEIKWEVEGEKDIAVGDILTITIKLTQKNLKENESLGFIHSNKFPFLKQSSWYLIFTDAEEISFLAMEKLVIKQKVFVKEIKERLGRPGLMQFFMILRNDSYRGFDKRI